MWLNASHIVLFIIFADFCTISSSSNFQLRYPITIRRQGKRSRGADSLSLANLLEVNIRPGSVLFASSKPQIGLRDVPTKRQQRQKKSKGSESPLRTPENVCTSASDWVAKTEAIDPFGNKVKVVQKIPVNGTTINQYFYETMCADNLVFEDDEIFGTTYRRMEDQRPSECKGVDKTKWNSVCKENSVWTHANVAMANGEIGWSWIMVRGSCGCAIWPTVHAKPSRPGGDHPAPAGSGRKSSWVKNARYDPFS